MLSCRTARSSRAREQKKVISFFSRVSREKSAAFASQIEQDVRVCISLLEDRISRHSFTFSSSSLVRSFSSRHEFESTSKFGFFLESLFRWLFLSGLKAKIRISRVLFDRTVEAPAGECVHSLDWASLENPERWTRLEKRNKNEREREREEWEQHSCTCCCCYFRYFFFRVSSMRAKEYSIVERENNMRVQISSIDWRSVRLGGCPRWCAQYCPSSLILDSIRTVTVGTLLDA